MSMDEIKRFKFALHCWKAGFSKGDFKKILEKLKYLHNENGPITSQGKQMVEYFELIQELKEKK